uniref:Rod shape-determining protein RodA n=1 Tax=candidate division CPR3 bacterium TaxID=2268181 RepID=A0A7C4RAM4_UNCC3
MNFLSTLDPGLILPIIGLTGISLSLIASTTSSLFSEQLTSFVIGFICYFIFASIDYRIYTRFTWLFYFISIALLGLTFFSPAVRGSNRWLSIGSFNSFQPSEVIKPIIVVITANLALNEKKNDLFSLLKRFLIFSPIIFIIFRQPDLGNVIVFLFIFFSMEIINGLSWIYYIFGIAALSALIPIIWHFLRDYQKLRVISFLNPQSDPAGAGYNSLQAMIAIGSGGLFGQGLGRGTQSHLLFLPEYHTDFVFASLGEELGLFGGTIVIVFYFLLLGRILSIAYSSQDEFGKLICIGIFSQIFIQVFINMGMNLGLLPITGITLPLLSYGGSSILGTCVALGMVVSIMRNTKSRSPIVIG